MFDKVVCDYKPKIKNRNISKLPMKLLNILTYAVNVQQFHYLKKFQ